MRYTRPRCLSAQTYVGAPLSAASISPTASLRDLRLHLEIDGAQVVAAAQLLDLPDVPHSLVDLPLLSFGWQSGAASSGPLTRRKVKLSSCQAKRSVRSLTRSSLPERVVDNRCGSAEPPRQVGQHATERAGRIPERRGRWLLVRGLKQSFNVGGRVHWAEPPSLLLLTVAPRHPLVLLVSGPNASECGRI